ncbi:conserved hypothetical protein [Trichinella spiralis]|uniref:hypothetical protein n=1 Tax=Trichinella spiralis TaxID=6334 RepID=UPI0001EFB817|nr:conserved hypothetical protein [Trichinella spiralis]
MSYICASRTFLKLMENCVAIAKSCLKYKHCLTCLCTYSVTECIRLSLFIIFNLSIDYHCGVFDGKENDLLNVLLKIRRNNCGILNTETFACLD